MTWGSRALPMWTGRRWTTLNFHVEGLEVGVAGRGNRPGKEAEGTGMCSQQGPVPEEGQLAISLYSEHRCNSL